ncbi:hypothetical protein [Neisseria polysaccharea]|uniref:hypothetical protein n=1 Tax=Neisseria polysaccharea TaxID=489 RepID=UPI001901B21F
MPSESPSCHSDGIFAPFVYKPVKSLYTQTHSKPNKYFVANTASPSLPPPETHQSV